MIRFVNRYTEPMYHIPASLFNCLDTETNILIEIDNVIPNENYYVFHIGKDTDRYKRVIALSYVDICETDQEDDLSDFGFKCIGQTFNGHKMWSR